jgi:hypothetical protein
MTVLPMQSAPTQLDPTLVHVFLASPAMELSAKMLTNALQMWINAMREALAPIPLAHTAVDAQSAILGTERTAQTLTSVHWEQTIATTKRAAPTPLDLSSAHAILDTGAMESIAQISTSVPRTQMTVRTMPHALIQTVAMLAFATAGTPEMAFYA